MRRRWGILIIMALVLSGALAACSPSPPASGLLGSGKFELRIDGRESIPVYYVTGARATEEATIIVIDRYRAPVTAGLAIADCHAGDPPAGELGPAIERAGH